MQAKMDAVLRRLDVLEERTVRQDGVIVSLEHRIREQDEEIGSLKYRIRTLNIEGIYLKARVKAQDSDILGYAHQLKSLRKQMRNMAYGQMLNTFVNVFKFACEKEPTTPAGGRKNSTVFQKKKDQLKQILRVVYPGRKMSALEVQRFIKNIDSLKDQRDRITHPRSIVELGLEVDNFLSMLQDHQNVGDEFTDNERLFLDVFSKFDALRAIGLGNLN